MRRQYDLYAQIISRSTALKVIVTIKSVLSTLQSDALLMQFVFVTSSSETKSSHTLTHTHIFQFVHAFVFSVKLARLLIF